MGKIDEMLIGMKVRAYCALEEFKNSERGDTNFISMLLILGIVVVLAGTFLTLAKTTVMEPIKTSVEEFMGKLKK